MLVGKSIGPFVIERELGCGAMGTVYRAVRGDGGPPVALKIIALGLLGNETAVKRFEREGDILKQLRHPNIVRFLGTGRYKKTPFFIMEYVEGESLDKVLARRGAFRWDEVVALGRQVCAALQHAHERGIIHRDLKPSNLMILKDGTVKLTDFGIAKDTDVTALTGANSTVGTAAYMSPEQCKGERSLSAKSDLYSMGVVFYELLTGRKPFIADSPVDMFLKHVNETPQRPSQTVMDIPVWLDTLVMQLLEKKPEHRPYDAAMVDKVLNEVEEKVATLRSAGVDAVSARAGDRSGRRKPEDETDREAARTLRGAVTKKRIRKKSVPLTQRKWAQAIALLLGLAACFGLFYWLTRPPSLDQLYSSARLMMDSQDSDAALRAIQRYLDRSPGADDPRGKELREARERILADRRERQLHNRFTSKLNLKPEDEGQRLGFEALRRENDGELEDAAQVWQEMEEKYKDESNPELTAYAWLARKKLAELKNLPAREQKLRAALDAEHALKPPERKPELDTVERACFEAYRYQQFGDLPAARDHWERVKEESIKDLDARPWAVLAAARARELKAATTSGTKEKEQEDRLKLLEEKFAQAQALPANADPNDTRRAVSICRDIVALYSRDAAAPVKEYARKAREQLRQWGRT